MPRGIRLCCGRRGGTCAVGTGAEELWLLLECRDPLERKRRGPWTLVTALLKVPGLRAELCAATTAYMLKAVLTLVSPMAVFGLLRWFKDPAGEARWGYAFAAANAVAVLGQHVFQKRYVASGARAGRTCQVATAGAIYRRTVELNAAALGGYESGELVNLASADAEHIADFWTGSILLAFQPLEIVATVSLLWFVVAEATLAALALCAVSYFGMQGIGRCIERQAMLKSSLCDERLKVLSEVLYGIKVIKANGWAQRFEERISAVARRESGRTLRKKLFMGPVFLLTSEMVDFMAFTVSLVSILICGQQADASRLFTMWVFMGVLHSRLFAFPEALRKVCSAWTSLRRVSCFLEGLGETVTVLPQEVTVLPQEVENGHECISIRKGVFFFGGQGDGGSRATTPKVVLRDINLSLKHGCLHAVLGRVGSGKTSLLLAILGEMHAAAHTRLSFGSGDGTKRLAYVPQEPVIFNDTVRANICFGRPFCAERYEAVCSACALCYDFELLPLGDGTLIGSRGINISGGQQSRIALARAAYSGADVYVLDDPIARLDARVGAEVLAQAILGLLRGQTRLIATHSAAVAARADVVVRVGGGTATVDGAGADASGEAGRIPSDAAVDELCEALGREVEAPMEGPPTACGESSQADFFFEVAPPRRASWLAGLRDFWRHLAAGLVSVRSAVFYFGIIAVEVVVIEVGVYFLALWSDDPGQLSASSAWYASMYSSCILLEIIIATTKYIVLALLTQRAWNQLHASLLSKVLGASLIWLQRIPVGHTLQLFSGTLGGMEERVFNCSELFFLNVSFLFAVTGVSCVVFPPFTFVLVVLGVEVIRIVRGLGGVANALRPADASLQRACVGHYTETLAGLTVVRTFEGARDFFIERFDTLLERRAVAQAKCSEADASLIFRLSLVGAMAYACAGFSIVVGREAFRISAGQAGFMLANCCFFTFILTEVVLNSVSLHEIAQERDLIHRLVQGLPQEAGAKLTMDGGAKPSSWPVRGDIQIDGLEVRYSVDLPPVLKGLSLEVRAGEHLGIIGRTGSGKSSLLLALCRLVEPSAGRVVIDGVDIGCIGLQELRLHLGVLSQDPLFFSGNLRENLDPFKEHSDEDLLTSLERVGLKGSFFRQVPEDSTPPGAGRATEPLDLRVAELGGNFSVGQRQLLCLARAALPQPRVVLVDEATASLDLQADACVQRVLRERFTEAGATVLQVAHRLRSLTWSSRIAVLDKGVLAELGTARELLLEPPPKGGLLFQEMVASLGPRDEAEFCAAVGVHDLRALSPRQGKASRPRIVQL